MAVNRIDGVGDELQQTCQGEPERIDGAFESFQHQDAHDATDTHFTAYQGKACAVCLRVKRILRHLAGQDKLRRRIDGQIELLKLVEDLVVVDGRRKVSERRTARDGRKPEREFADGLGVVVRLDVLTASGDGDRIKHFEEIEAEHPKEPFGVALFVGEFCPDVISLLCLAEDVVDRSVGVEQRVHSLGVAFVGQLQLVFEVVEAVVDGCGREHQHLGLHSGTNHLVHQAQITVLARVIVVIVPCDFAAVAEVVRLINDHQVIIAPVDFLQLHAIGAATNTRKVGMEQDGIAEPVASDWIGDVVGPIGHPVVAKLLGAEYQDILVARLVVFDDGESGEGLTQPHAVSQDTAVVFFQLVDDGQCRIFLEIVKLVPDLAVLEASGFVGQHVLGNIFKKLVEDIVEGDEIDELGRVFAVDVGDMINDVVSDIGKILFVVPKLVEHTEILTSVCTIDLVDEVHHAVAAFAAQVSSGETIHRRIGAYIIVGNVDEARKGVACGVRLEAYFLLYPIRAFNGDGLLGELVAKLHLEGRAIEGALTVDARDVELAPLLVDSFGGERRRSEDKTKLLDVFQLLFQLLKGIYGEAASSH